MGSSLLALASAALVLVSNGANAARVCKGDASGSLPNYQLRIGDLRYDGDNPGSKVPFGTVAANLMYTTTPLYECVAQWPVSWAGYYEGGSSIIWSDCIYTGAGPGQDNTVSFAMDWKKKTFYLTHSFACSDEPG
jgi:hypothetical protein